MSSARRSILNRPLFSRKEPLDRDHAASRISAYVYGNILVLAALIPITTARSDLAIPVVLGTALSTFVAHAFAESVGHGVHTGHPQTRTERLADLRDSVPVLTSAVLPVCILFLAQFGWIEFRTAQLIADIVIVVRIASVVFVVQRLNGQMPSRATIVGAVGLASAAAIVVAVKVLLTH